MEREELLKQCRYYAGQKENPNKDGNMAWFWDMERVYVENGGVLGGEADYYKSINGKIYPGVPYNLLTTMFTSWGKWTYDIKGSICEFYKLIDEYLFIANDHFPEDKIPPEGFRY